MMFNGRQNPWMQSPWGQSSYEIDPEAGGGGYGDRGHMGHASPNGYFRSQQGMQLGGNQMPQPFDPRGQDDAPAMERGFAPQPLWDEKAQPLQSWADKSFQMPPMGRESMPQPSWDAKDLQPDKPAPTWGAKAIPAPQRQGTFGGFRTQPQSGGLANMFRGGRRF